MKAPTENLFRALRPGIELRADNVEDGMPTMFGHFTPFNVWTEIHSFFEGDFLEQIVPGSFKRTINNNRDQIKVEFNHGHDPQIGDKVLGPIDVLREEKKGPYYEVPLFDTSYNRDLLPGLEASVYGASFRFRVIRDEWNDEPGTSKENPKGLPERTIKEVQLYEFGPVTFPAYAEATAGVRSLTDHFLERMLRDEDTIKRLHEFYEHLSTPSTEPAKHGTSDEDGPAEPPPLDSREHSEAWTQADRRKRLLALTQKGA